MAVLYFIAGAFDYYCKQFKCLILFDILDYINERLTFSETVITDN